MNLSVNASPAKMFLHRHGLAVGVVLLVLFKLWLVHNEDIYGSATEFDALWFVNAAKHWYWGSEYSWTAFVRPPAYPLFIALLHLLRIPLRLGIELMQAGGYLALVAGLRKAGAPRLVCLASYAAMILHPVSDLNRTTMADTFYIGILPLAVGGLLLTLLTAKRTHAVWTGIALAVLWNNREESFLIPPMLIIFFAVALFRGRLQTRAWKPAAVYWLKPASAMIGTLLLLNLAVDAANYRAFHSFSKSQLNSASYKSALKALLRIKPSQTQRFVSVSTEVLQMAYAASPTFAQLKPQLEGDLGRVWQVPTLARLGVHEFGPWFTWALRNAAANNQHETPASANRFYRTVAREINRACDDGRIPSRFVLSSFLDPGAIANIGYMPQSVPRIASLFLYQSQTVSNRDDAILTESQRSLYDEMTGRGTGPGFGEGMSTAVQNLIGSYYRFLVVALSVAGLIAGLLLTCRFRELRITDSINAALTLLAATILLRVTLFTFLDATWWIGGNERYVAPVMPMYSCFLILLIYQSVTVWRNPGPKT